MNALRELQQEMFAALLQRPTGAARHVVDNGLTPEQRLAVYRNNLFQSLTGALEAVYPTIRRLVGEGFFRYAAHEYIRLHPSRSGNLHAFGGGFGRFLHHFEPARELPYLGDVAQLEWALHEVLHAPSAKPRAHLLTALSDLPEQALAAMGLDLHPATRLVASRFPVLRIWQVNRMDVTGHTGQIPEVNLDQGGQQVLVMRHTGEVMLEPLGAGGFALLATLADGSALGSAVAAALCAEPGFDVGGFLARHLAAGTLVRPAGAQPLDF